MEKNISFATERMGMNEIPSEGATEKALNKPDDLEITKKAMERVVNSVDEVLALCLELDLEKKNNPATTRDESRATVRKIVVFGRRRKQ